MKYKRTVFRICLLCLVVPVPSLDLCVVPGVSVGGGGDPIRPIFPRVPMPTHKSCLQKSYVLNMSRRPWIGHMVGGPKNFPSLIGLPHSGRRV